MLDDPIDIKGLTSIVIMDASIFAKFIQNLHEYTEESENVKLFDSKFKSLKTLEVMIITDILNHDINSSSILKIIHEDLNRQISESPETKSEIEQALGRVLSLLHKEILDFEIDLGSEEVTLLDIMKLIKLKVEVVGNSIFERVFDIMQLFKYLTKQRLLVFINLTTYLSTDELKSLEEYAELQNIPVLLVERHPLEGSKKQTIIDEDFVVFS